MSQNQSQGALDGVSPQSPPGNQPPCLRIEPSKGWVSFRLKELWTYRELFVFFVWRDIKVRYKQTILGGAWAILQPFMTMVVFSLFFGKLAKVPSDGIPYPLFNFAALVPWTFFANGITQGANSMVGASNLIKKVYFPRMVIPSASIFANLVDFVLAFTVLLAMMAYFGYWPTWHVVFLPLFLLLALVTGLGVALWLSAMNVQFRDIKYTVPFIVQFWMFASPVAYGSSLLEEPWRTVYGLNPLTGVIEGFRWSLLGNQPPGPMIYVSAVAALLIFVTGALYFRRMEKSFADVV